MKKTREVKFAPYELVSMFAAMSFKRNAVPFIDRAYENRLVYNITEGRNIPYGMPQLMFFNEINSDFYGTFREIQELNKVNGACANDLQSISVADIDEYKENCIQLRKGAKAEYIFSFSPKYSIKENLSEERKSYAASLLKSKDYSRIKDELADNDGVLSSLSYVISYARLFSSKDILNLNPEYLDRRRAEIRENSPYIPPLYDAEQCLEAAKHYIKEKDLPLNTHSDRAAFIEQYAGELFASSASRAKDRSGQGEDQEKVAKEFLSAMIARSCGFENDMKVVRPSGYKRSQEERYSKMDGVDIYNAIISANAAYRKFNGMCEKYYQTELDKSRVAGKTKSDSGKEM